MSQQHRQNFSVIYVPYKIRITNFWKSKYLKNFSMNTCSKHSILLPTNMSSEKPIQLEGAVALTHQDATTVLPHRPPPQLHTILEEHGYKLIKKIGSGSFAKVNTATSQKERRIVAIKIVSKSRAPHDYLTKFLPREVDVVKGLDHENIIKYYRCIETTRRVYIVMQYAENGSLLEMIRKRSQLPEAEARSIYLQLVSAIEYLHSKGIVHRDIKCENLLFDSNNVLKIIDFGFSRRHVIQSPRNMSETYCGSFAYACPEILRGEPYDPRHADVWATGVVLFAMVFARLPFDDASVTRLVKQVYETINFSTQGLQPISDACKACIRRILSPYVKANFPRILEDPWIQTNEELNDLLVI